MGKRPTESPKAAQRRRQPKLSRTPTDLDIMGRDLKPGGKAPIAEDSAKVIAIRPQEPEGGDEGVTGAEMRWPTREELEAEARARSLPADKWGAVYCDLRDGSWIEVRRDGVFQCGLKPNPNNPQVPKFVEQYVSTPFSVEAATEPADDGGEHGVVLRWQTQRGKIRTEVVPKAFPHKMGGAFSQWLAVKGINFKRGMVGVLVDYVTNATPDKRIPCYSRTGWQQPSDSGAVFVLHDRVVGAPGAVFQPGEANASAATSSRGTFDEWLVRVARPGCALGWWRTALLASFAAPLLRPLDQPGRFFHAVGTTSRGKTVGAAIAASVWGRGTQQDEDSFFSTWNNTANALASMAAAHNHLPLILDEIAEADPRTINRVVYQIAHGTDRGRQNSNAELKDRKRWRTLVVSTGEQTLASIIKKVDAKMSGGVAVRFLELPVASSGLLTQLDDAEVVKRIEGAVGQVYGTAGPKFVEWLVAQGFGDLESDRVVGARKRLDEIEDQLIGADTDSRRRRAARAFAVLQLAGELAVEAGVAPAEIAPAATAAAAFAAWAGDAGENEIDDLRRIGAKVLAFFNAERDVSIFGAGADGDANRSRNGWWKKDAGNGRVRFWLLPAAFEPLLDGIPARDFCKVAFRRDAMTPGDDRHLGARIPSGLTPDGTRPRAYEFNLDELEAWVDDAISNDSAPVPF